MNVLEDPKLKSLINEENSGKNNGRLKEQY